MTENVKNSFVPLMIIYGHPDQHLNYNVAKNPQSLEMMPK